MKAEEENLFYLSKVRNQSIVDIFGQEGLEPLTPTNKPCLIANRGEISIRVIRSCHELGLKTIAIYSYEDRLSMHRYKADESFQIAEQGKYSPVGAYLAIDDIVEIAVKRNVGVIHPGYGFLSENCEFARKVEEAGIAFAGPSHKVIEECGDKTKARALALRVGVPVCPGSNGPVKDLNDAREFIKHYGFPVIIKAAMGGGGRGMRIVRDMDSLGPMFERAVSESKSAFGDGTVFLERYVDKPRHIEVQLLADSYGNVIHLFERDCSVQRRFQKVVEMAPALNLPEEVRQSILNDAIKLAKAVGYRSAGTAEFLVDQENRYYFIEINPRIQVEHTVTEEITGVDIVSAQIQIALGASLADLGLIQENISFRGCTIQCRVTTEDPYRNFQPDTGRIEVYRSCAGHGVRLDGGPGFSGAIVSPYYDSLLVKCTVSGRTFDLTRRKMLRALTEFRGIHNSLSVVRGLKTNIGFLVCLLRHPTFVKGGKIWTTFIDDTPELLHEQPFKNRGQKILRYLGDLVVNGPRVKGQKGFPQLQTPALIPSVPNIPDNSVSQPCQVGWRNVLLSEGPKAFVQAIRKHPRALIMDTTWRDAHQSLLATRVRTIDMANIAPVTSHILQTAFALECWGGATFDVSMRFLWECPWERLKCLRKLVPNIPFSMLLRGANAVGYTSYPDNVVYEFCKKAVACGVDIFRVFDSLNYDENLKLGVDAVVKAGGVAEGAISYTGDVSDSARQRYDIDYYLNLTDKLVNAGIHILGIKDMAGLLKPQAATLLISSIRKRHPDLVIHVHTHDTAGTGVASMLEAVKAGADIVDLAIDSMSGLTSQPSLGAFVAGLQGTELDTGLDLNQLQVLNSYWEQMRLLYSCFDPGLKSGDSGVYIHEMPGGQYTNLLFQSQSLGLGSRWLEVKKAYKAANNVCGDIVKVTPSSKVVGDLAQFMVAQKLTEEDVYAHAETLSFPNSVLEYFQGLLGEPPYGFPEPLRTRILKSKKLEKIVGRPGASMNPLDLDHLRISLQEKYDKFSVSDYDILSAALYPKVFEDYRNFKDQYGDLSSLPTLQFLTPLKIGEEFSFELEVGKTLIISLIAIGPVNEQTGKRDVFFNLNGEARVVSINDETLKNTKSETTARVKVDPKDKTQIGAPMAGVIVDLRAKEGSTVKIGDPIAVMSAMKIETVINSTCDGIIEKVYVKADESLSAGDMIVKIKA